jgi:murein DD-endopeptidase MepM/ murein hydrolase activator NlpD
MIKSTILGQTLLIGSLLFLSNCAGVKPISKDKSIGKEDKVTPHKEEEKVPTEFGFFKGEVKPGEVSLLRVKGPFVKEGSLTCDTEKVDYFLKEYELWAFVSETYFSDLKPFSCYYQDQKGSPVKIGEFKVVQKEFPSEKLSVDKKRVFLSKKDSARANRERLIRAKAYNSSPKTPYFFTPFELPIESLVTSIYGSKRLFNNKKQTQHLGTDFRAAVGVPIKTANRGKVVISRDFFYTGNTIIIDHGMGIFTTYGHLSKRLVQEGEIIPEGTIIGHAGATGRVTGPHLHWGVTVNNLAVEGDSLVEASLPLGK